MQTDDHWLWLSSSGIVAANKLTNRQDSEVIDTQEAGAPYARDFRAHSCELVEPA